MEHKIRCEVVKISEGKTCKVGMQLGDIFAVGPLTPAPKPICSAAFLSLYALGNPMRFADRTKFEDSQGNQDVVCPDGTVTFRLSRKNEKDKPER